ncbi:MAG TPA: hypothetical protein VFN31_01605 [Candidatus Saccharimonadales bacterium]|nr:hypothetical protein [Candidatus Saccharimonadales bacterium]
MDEAKSSLAERLTSANNVLVTVSRNPSVDQLSALLGLSLFLNKEGKHCAAVFSGQIPSTLEFLKPESTIQKNTDSLRDFIIALDKSKADKLRYKVEDNVVRIFITPYKSSIGQDDLEFSQGDFNVDIVVALGVSEQSELDEAITAHGRILHDATVASINVGANSNLGSINWNDPAASSLSELVTELTQMVNPDSLDEQIATALLTGIVASTDRFSNDKTTSQTMSISSLLMAAGANQQLVATKLEEDVPHPGPIKRIKPEAEKPEESEAEKPKEPGTLEIKHKTDEETKAKLPEDNLELPEPKEEEGAEKSESPAGLSGGPKLVTEPPSLGGTLTANSRQNDLEPTTDPLSLPKAENPSLLTRKVDTSSRAPFKPLENLSQQTPSPLVTPAAPQLTSPPSDWFVSNPTPTVEAPPVPAVISPPPAPTVEALPEPPVMTSPAVPTPVEPEEPEPKKEAKPEEEKPPEIHIDENGEIRQVSSNNTLSQLEESVDSPHLHKEADDTDAARAAVSQALASGPDNSLPTPSPALNAQPLGPELHPDSGTTPPPVPPPFNPTLT